MTKCNFFYSHVSRMIIMIFWGDKYTLEDTSKAMSQFVLFLGTYPANNFQKKRK